MDLTSQPGARRWQTGHCPASCGLLSSRHSNGQGLGPVSRCHCQKCGPEGGSQLSPEGLGGSQGGGRGLGASCAEDHPTDGWGPHLGPWKDAGGERSMKGPKEGWAAKRRLPRCQSRGAGRLLEQP